MTAANDYQKHLGERLRAIRNQQGITLQDVEDRSEGTWKAVVVGSYERGDRAISVAKLASLAGFYGVPIADLLPERNTGTNRDGSASRQRLVLDLTRLSDLGARDDTMEALARYAMHVQVERGDYNGRMLTLRGDDLRALAVAFGADPDQLIERLVDESVLVGT